MCITAVSMRACWEQLGEPLTCPYDVWRVFDEVKHDEHCATPTPRWVMMRFYMRSLGLYA